VVSPRIRSEAIRYETSCTPDVLYRASEILHCRRSAAAYGWVSQQYWRTRRHLAEHSLVVQVMSVVVVALSGSTQTCREQNIDVVMATCKIFRFDMRSLFNKSRSWSRYMSRDALLTDCVSSFNFHWQYMCRIDVATEYVTRHLNWHTAQTKIYSTLTLYLHKTGIKSQSKRWRSFPINNLYGVRFISM